MNEGGHVTDVLVFDRREVSAEELQVVERLCELDDDECEAVVRKAKLAIESEFSPYNYAHRLKEYGKELSFTIKEEDLQPTSDWREHFGVEVGIVQVFLDGAYMLTVGNLLAGIKDGSIKRSWERSYSKYVYYPPMSRGIVFGTFVEPPNIGAEVILDRYGKYTAYRKVGGGKVSLTEQARTLLGLR